MNNPILHTKLIELATDMPRRKILAALIESAERDADRISQLLTKAYAEGLRDGFTQGVLSAGSDGEAPDA